MLGGGWASSASPPPEAAPNVVDLVDAASTEEGEALISSGMLYIGVLLALLSSLSQAPPLLPSAHQAARSHWPSGAALGRALSRFCPCRARADRQRAAEAGRQRAA